MGLLEGQAILLTGGGSGLGRGLVERFVGEGATVGVLERSEAKADALTSAFGDSVCVTAGDVGGSLDTRRAVSSLLERTNQLDAVVGCAAITDYGFSVCALGDDEFDKGFDEIMAINVKGYLTTARETARHLRPGGSITLTLSTAGIFAGGGGALYTISKHACIGVVRQLALELAPNVRVNGVVPGGISGSDIRGPVALEQDGITPTGLIPNLEEIGAQTAPLRMFPQPRDYAGIFTLLASREAAPATGSIIHWDTGIGMVGHGPALSGMFSAAQ